MLLSSKNAYILEKWLDESIEWKRDESITWAYIQLSECMLKLFITEIICYNPQNPDTSSDYLTENLWSKI